jgi:hypothetical protein
MNLQRSLHMDDNPNQAEISVGFAVSASTSDYDLLDQLLSAENYWLEASTSTPNTTSFPPFWQPKSSIKERVREALNFINDARIESDFLVQLWVPVQRGSQLVLTTGDQPFTLGENSDKLVNYRNVSTSYEFSAEVGTGQSLGLPGRVFVGKLPEWTPDVRFFSTYEYPRVNYAHKFDVHGSIAIPVFERGSGTCLGVVEVIMTAQKTSFAPELVTICSALQVIKCTVITDKLLGRININVDFISLIRLLSIRWLDDVIVHLPC